VALKFLQLTKLTTGSEGRYTTCFNALCEGNHIKWN